MFEDKYNPIARNNVKKLAYIPDINSNTNMAKVGNYLNKAVIGPIQVQNTQAVSTSGYNSLQPPRRINFNEMQLRKAKALCFNYDEKFSPLHRCQNRRLLFLQWEAEPPDG